MGILAIFQRACYLISESELYHAYEDLVGKGVVKSWRDGVLRIRPGPSRT